MLAGLASVTFRGLSAEQIIEFAARCELDCIEWGADVHARPDDVAALDKIAKRSKQCGIQPVSYGSYYKAGCDNEFSARQIIDAAARLGVRRIRVWAGNKSAASVSAAEFDAMADDLRTVTELAAKQNMTVATEFHHHSYTEFARDARKLLDAVPGLRTYWQENPQLSALDNYGELKRVLPYVDTVHVFCFDKSLNRYPLENAKERWHAYIGAVKEEGKNDLPFLIEFVQNDSTERAAADARLLKTWLEEWGA